MMLRVEWFTIRIAAFDVEVFIARRTFCLSLLPVALVIACAAQGAQVADVQFQVWMRAAWVDVVNPGLSLPPDAGAADGAGPAVPVQRHEPERTPSWRPVEPF